MLYGKTLSQSVVIWAADAAMFEREKPVDVQRFDNWNGWSIQRFMHLQNAIICILAHQDVQESESKIDTQIYQS